MRVRTFHRHTVSRTSTLLGALLPLHLLYSLCFTLPIFYTYHGIRWSREGITGNQKAWMLCMLLIFTILEVIRFVIGYHANIKMVLADLSAYMGISIAPQLIIIILWYHLVPNRNDLEYSVCVVQLTLLCCEALTAARMLWRLGRNNTVDFHVMVGTGAHYW